jgi:hypothetical protein
MLFLVSKIGASECPAINKEPFHTKEEAMKRAQFLFGTAQALACTLEDENGATIANEVEVLECCKSVAPVGGPSPHKNC